MSGSKSMTGKALPKDQEGFLAARGGATVPSETKGFTQGTSN
jgi:hypothetical protein